MIDDLKLDLAKLKDYDNFASNLTNDKTGEKSECDIWFYMEWAPISPEFIVIGLQLIFPEFIEVDGCVFLKDKFGDPENFIKVRHSREGVDYDKEYYECIINRIKLDELFNDKYVCWDDADKYAYSIDYLGKVMERSWKRELEHRFKDRRFHVEYYNNINDEPIVYFHTIRE